MENNQKKLTGLPENAYRELKEGEEYIVSCWSHNETFIFRNLSKKYSFYL